MSFKAWFETCNKKLLSVLSYHCPNLAIYTDLLTLRVKSSNHQISFALLETVLFIHFVYFQIEEQFIFGTKLGLADDQSQNFQTPIVLLQLVSFNCS